jgi:hypothetical protein
MKQSDMMPIDDPKDIGAAIVEVDVFDFRLPDGAAVELTVTLLDIQNDAVAMAKRVREHGAQAFGMLFFKSAPVLCPKEAGWTSTPASSIR